MHLKVFNFMLLLEPSVLSFSRSKESLFVPLSFMTEGQDYLLQKLWARFPCFLVLSFSCFVSSSDVLLFLVSCISIRVSFTNTADTFACVLGFFTILNRLFDQPCIFKVCS